jgi:hypothetical protein
MPSFHVLAHDQILDRREQFFLEFADESSLHDALLGLAFDPIQISENEIELIGWRPAIPFAQVLTQRAATIEKAEASLAGQRALVPILRSAMLVCILAGAVLAYMFVDTALVYSETGAEVRRGPYGRTSEHVLGAEVIYGAATCAALVGFAICRKLYQIAKPDPIPGRAALVAVGGCHVLAAGSTALGAGSR